MSDEFHIKEILSSRCKHTSDVLEKYFEVEATIDSLFDLNTGIFEKLDTITDQNISLEPLKLLCSAVAASHAQAIFLNLQSFQIQSKHFSRRGIEALRYFVVCIEKPELPDVWRYSINIMPDTLKDMVPEANTLKDNRTELRKKMGLSNSKYNEIEDRLIKHNYYHKGKAERDEKFPDSASNLKYLDERHLEYSYLSVHLNPMSIGDHAHVPDSSDSADDREATSISPFAELQMEESMYYALESAQVWLLCNKVVMNFCNSLDGFELPSGAFNNVNFYFNKWIKSAIEEFKNNPQWQGIRLG